MNTLSTVDTTAEAKSSGIAEEFELTLQDIAHQLWFRRRLLLSTTFFIALAGLVVINQLVPRYTASSRMMIGLPQAQVVDIDAVLAGMVSGGDWSIMGEIEVLQSRELAKKVVEKLNLLALEEFNPGSQPRSIFSYLNPLQYIPNEWKLAIGQSPPMVLTDEEVEYRRMVSAVSRLVGMLSVVQVRDSNVVQISVESTNPRLATRIANELPELYIVGQLEAKFEATRKATTWLNERLSDLQKKVAVAENAVELYRQKRGITDIKGSGVLMEQLLAINSELVVARAERAEVEARLGQARTLQRTGSERSIESASHVLASNLIQRLKEKEVEVRRKASELATEYGKMHPKMLQVNAELRDIENGIQREIEKTVASLKNDVGIVRSRERSLQQSLDELEDAHGLQKQESVQLRALEREAAANRALFETFLGRFKETSSSGGIEEPDARVISRAEVPGMPTFPNKKLIFVTILVLAIIISVLLVFLVEILTPGVRSPEQVERELGISTIGLIPRVRNAEPQEYVLDKPHSHYAEALNSLKTSMMLSGVDKPVKIVMITSSVPGEGKSTLALSFSRLLARSGKSVVLVDADLRRTGLESKLKTQPDGKGLTDLVLAEDNVDLFDYGVVDELSGALYIPKGSAEFVNASDILSSHRIEAILSRLRAEFDYVILDTPPVMPVSDSRLLGRMADKTLFVVRWDKTPKKVIEAALSQIPHVDLAGCVLQQVDLGRYGRYGYGDSGYYYHYGKYGYYYKG